MSRKTILVIDNYDSFTWNLVHYLEELGAQTRVVRNDELTVEEALASGADGILLSPGPCSPNEAGICVALIQQVGNHIDLFLDVVGRSRFNLRLENVESFTIVMKDLRPMLCNFLQGFAFFTRLCDGLVVNISQVANMDYLEAGNL